MLLHDFFDIKKPKIKEDSWHGGGDEPKDAWHSEAGVVEGLPGEFIGGTAGGVGGAVVGAAVGGPMGALVGGAAGGTAGQQAGRELTDEQKLNEIAPLLAIGARLFMAAAPKIAQVFGKVGQAGARGVGQAAKAGAGIAAKNAGQIGIGAGAYEIGSSVADIVKDITTKVGAAVDEKTIFDLATLAFKYAIPAGIVLAILYGGKKAIDSLFADPKTTKGVVEGSEQEGSTFKNSLRTIIRVATHLEKQMGDDENFPEWESEMVGSVKDQIVRIMDYEISKKGQQGVAEGLANVLAKAIMPAEKTLATKSLANPLKPGEMPPDIKMLINKVQNKVPLRPDEYSKLQAYKAFRDADSMSLKEANMLARALREGSAGKVGKGGTKPIDKEKKAAMKNATTIPGLNMATGSMYKNYRMGIALAGAPTFPTKMEADNWIGGDPLISSYTEEEFEMVKAAAKQVGAGKIQNWSGKRSEEVADVNKTSTVAKVKRNKYGI